MYQKLYFRPLNISYETDDKIVARYWEIAIITTHAKFNFPHPQVMKLQT